MKRTTYLFIAGVILFIAATYSFQHMEYFKAKEPAVQKTYTPFTIKNIRDDYESLTLDKLKMYKYQGPVESYVSSSNRDTIWTGELSGDSLSFFSFDFQIVTTHKTISFINDGIPIVYDEQADSLLEGSELNRKFVEIQKAERSFNQHGYRVPYTYIGQEMVTLTPETKEMLMKECEDGFAHLETFRKTIKEFCKDNKDNALPAYFIVKYAKLFSSSAVEGLIDPQATYMKHQLMEHNEIFQLICRYPKGTPFTDLDLYTTQGQEVKLSQWVGKGHCSLVFINNEMDLNDLLFIWKAYDKYHTTKGLEVINISTYPTYNGWKNLFEHGKMPWIYLASFDHLQQIMDSYGDSRQSSIILFDAEGKVIDYNIHDVEIEKTLKAVYGE